MLETVWVGHLVDPVVKLWVTQKIWIQLYQYKEFLSLKKSLLGTSLFIGRGVRDFALLPFP